MNPLLKRLASLRRTVRIYAAWIGVCALSALVLGVGVGEGVLDFYFHIPSLFRGAILVGLLVAVGYAFHRLFIQPFATGYDDLQLALRIEDCHPDMNDALASTVQFLKQTPEEQARLGGSEAMRQRTMQDTLAKLDQCDFGRILADERQIVFPSIFTALYGLFAIAFRPKQAVSLWNELWAKSKYTFAGTLMYSALIAAGTVLGMNLYQNSYAGIAFRRFVEPFGMHTWTTINVMRQVPIDAVDNPLEDPWKPVDPKEKERIAKGQPYFIEVNLKGQMPRHGDAKVEIWGPTKSDKTVKLDIAADKQSATFKTAIDMTQQYQDFKFRILSNDGSFPPRANTWHEVKVVPEPKLVGPALVTIYPPKYLELPPQKIVDGASLVEVQAGSTVVLRGKADRPLKDAWIEYVPQNPNLIDAARLSMIGFTDPMPAAAAAIGGHAVWGRFPAVFEKDRAVFDITFAPWVTGKFVLHLRDFDKLSHQVATELTVKIDPIPEVKLQAPRASMTVLKNSDIDFKAIVSDEQFAIRSVYVEYRRKGAGADSFDKEERTPLYDAAAFGKLLPALSLRLGRAPLPGAHPLMGKFPLQPLPFHLRHKKLDIDMVWSLRDEFKVGDIIVVELCADDFCDIYPGREPGRSHAVELRIISKTEMIDGARAKENDLFKELQKILKIEQGALEAVKETQQLQKSDQKAVDQFGDKAERPQREVQDRVGKSLDEGVRKEVKELRRTLEQNKLTGTQAYRDLTKIQGALDSIAQKELPEIEPKLAEVREDLTKDEKVDAKTKKNLAAAARLQERVVKTLSELINELNPEAKMNELREEMRGINQKEKDLLNRAESLNNEKRDIDMDPNADKKIFKEKHDAEIKKLQKEQTELAGQMEKFIQKMKDAKAEFEKQGDQANAKKIDDALKEAGQQEEEKKPMPEKKNPISGEMKKIAKDLEMKNEVQNQTLDKQKDLVKQMENVMDKLDGKSDEGFKQAMKDRKDAEKKIDDLNKKLDKLREAAKKADMIEDKQERLKKKVELAQQHEQLMEDIEKTRRELARLNEPRAERELNEAAKNIEKAAQKLAQGDNPEPDQKKAKEDLDRAKQELKEAQEELAREMLVKMADQLDGLKKRQVASLERSENLQTKILARKIWTEPFMRTMDGNIDAQKDIGDDTDNLKDKLKEAKVFHNVLEKAKKSMDDAGGVMKIRREEAPQRQENKFDDMELKDEVNWHGDTVKHQKSAVKRLDMLLDSIKEEIDNMDKKKEAKKNNPDEPPPDEEPKGGMKNQDGIPPQAQLKVLRALQLDLNERTADFAKRVPDLAKMTEDQKKELQELSEEQASIHQLFQQILPPPPELKEEKGAPK